MAASGLFTKLDDGSGWPVAWARGSVSLADFLLDSVWLSIYPLSCSTLKEPGCLGLVEKGSQSALCVPSTPKIESEAGPAVILSPSSWHLPSTRMCQICFVLRGKSWSKMAVETLT